MTSNTNPIFLPVHSPRTLIWFDIHLIEVDINLWDFNLEAVGQQFNGFAHGAIAGTSGHHEEGLGPNGSCGRQNQHRLGEKHNRSCVVKVLPAYMQLKNA